jgi:hypothetical protein
VLIEEMAHEGALKNPGKFGQINYKASMCLSSKLMPSYTMIQTSAVTCVFCRFAEYPVAIASIFENAFLKRGRPYIKA